MKIILDNISPELDQIQIAQVILTVGTHVLGADLESSELMDGSFRIDTPHGYVYMSVEDEEEGV